MQRIGKNIKLTLIILFALFAFFIGVRYMINIHDGFNDILPVTKTTEPVVVYENPIQTNPGTTKPAHAKSLGLYSFVEPNKAPPGHYNNSKLDLLVTNGLYTIGSNWLYDALFAV